MRLIKRSNHRHQYLLQNKSMSCLKLLVSTCAGNTESGVVADCGSKELLVIAMMIMVNMKMMIMVDIKMMMMVRLKVILMLKLMALKKFNVKIASKETNSCHEKDDFFTCVCNADG